MTRVLTLSTNARVGRVRYRRANRAVIDYAVTIVVDPIAYLGLWRCCDHAADVRTPVCRTNHRAITSTCAHTGRARLTVALAGGAKRGRWLLANAIRTHT